MSGIFTYLSESKKIGKLSLKKLCGIQIASFLLRNLLKMDGQDRWTKIYATACKRSHKKSNPRIILISDSITFLCI